MNACIEPIRQARTGRYAAEIVDTDTGLKLHTTRARKHVVPAILDGIAWARARAESGAGRAPAE